MMWEYALFGFVAGALAMLLIMLPLYFRRHGDLERVHRELADARAYSAELGMELTKVEKERDQTRGQLDIATIERRAAEDKIAELEGELDAIKGQIASITGPDKLPA